MNLLVTGEAGLPGLILFDARFGRSDIAQHGNSEHIIKTRFWRGKIIFKSYLLRAGILTLVILSSFSAKGSNLAYSAGLSISPGTALATAGQQIQFTAMLDGLSTTAVTWALNYSGGSVSPSGLYTAPASITTWQGVTLTVASVTNPAVHTSLMISLSPGNPTLIGTPPTPPSAPTPDPTLFQISNLIVSNITTNSATITFSSGIPANGGVTYFGPGISAWTNLSDGLSFVTSHSLVLSNLKAGSTYQFWAYSYETTKDVQSNVVSFATPSATPPPISTPPPITGPPTSPGVGLRVPTPVGSTQQVYYVGNSLTDLMNYAGVQSLAANAGYVHNWGRDVIPGAPLYWIRDHQYEGFSETPSGEYPSAFANYLWDTVTFEPFNSDADTSIVDIGNYGDRQVIDGWLRTIAPVSPNVQVYIYARWPFTAASGNTAQTFKAEWEQQYYPSQASYLSTNSITSRAYFEHVVQMVKADNTTIKAPLIIPVGEVMYEINDAIISGQITGYNSIWDIYADNVHLNHQVGSYIVGLTFYSSIYFADPRGTPVPAQYQPVDSVLAAQIQNIVWNVVSNYAYSNGSYVTSTPTSIPGGSAAPSPPVPTYAPLVPAN